MVRMHSDHHSNPLSFVPSVKLEVALKHTQSQLDQLARDCDAMAEDELMWLHRWALISTVGASTRIENAGTD